MLIVKGKGYNLTLEEPWVQLIQKQMVCVMVQKTDNWIPASPFVELQTDEKQTSISDRKYVGKFKNWEEAETCAREIAAHLHLPCKLAAG